MRSSVVRIGDRRRAGAERDAALARMRRARRLLTVGTLGLAAAFTAMADGATPAFNKHGGAVAAAGHRSRKAVVIHPSSGWPHARHHRSKRRHPAAAASAAPASPAPSAPAPAPQPPPAAPAPTQQAPAATSGGS